MKHIICLVDGTWNTAFQQGDDTTYSNIFNLNLLLKNISSDGRPQIAFYIPGLGSRNSLFSWAAGAAGRGLLELVEETYIDICSNYVKGDKISIFGFSRGAAVARIVAGLISADGLLKPEFIREFRGYFTDYIRKKWRVGFLRDYLSFELGYSTKTKGKKGRKLPKDYRVDHEVEINFLGVFDTVYGITWLSDKALKDVALIDRSIPKRVKNAVQILSCDEYRPFFSESGWTGLEGSNRNGHFEQVWMPGSHGDIGGLYHSDYLGNLALLTMLDRAEKFGQLEFENLEYFKSIANDAVGFIPEGKIIHHATGPINWLLRGIGKVSRPFSFSTHRRVREEYCCQRVSSLCAALRVAGEPPPYGDNSARRRVRYKLIKGFENLAEAERVSERLNLPKETPI